MFKIIKEWYTEELINNNPNWIFIFGDNLKRQGYGGQARVCRGKKNCFGIPTKLNPDYNPKSFMTDKPEYMELINQHFLKIQDMLEKKMVVCFPADGIGTGRANLKQSAPKVLKLINEWVEVLNSKYGENN